MTPDPWEHRRPDPDPLFTAEDEIASYRKPGVPRAVLVWVVLAVVAVGVAGIVVAVKW